MNKKIYKILEGNVMKFDAITMGSIASSQVNFTIFDNFFTALREDKKLVKASGIELISTLVNGQIRTGGTIKFDAQEFFPK